MADITDSTGHSICPKAQKGERHPHRKTKYVWPNQEKISARYWTIWTTCVKDTFCGHKKPELHTPLGKWHSNADSQTWETYVDHMTGNLIRQQEVDGSPRYMSYKAHPMKNYIAYTKGKGTEIQRPDTMYRISMYSESPISWVFNKPGNSTIRQDAAKIPQFLLHQHEIASGPSPPETQTWERELQKSNLQILRRIQGPVQENGSRQHLAAALRKGKLVGASDGTVKDGKGAHAWILSTTRSKNFRHNIQGSGPVDGNIKSMNSTRAERAGLLGPLFNTLGLAQEFQLGEGTLHMHVDNMGAYGNGNAPQRGEGTFKHVIQDYDYKLHKSSLEFKLNQDHNITVEYHHVKAHQDDKPLKDKEGKPIPLTAAARLNIHCDRQAEKERSHPSEGYEPKINPEMSNGTQLFFKSHGVINVNNLQEQIHNFRV